MDTSIVSKTLSDNSEVFAVVFVDGSNMVRIECESMDAAVLLQGVLDHAAYYATIEYAAS